MSQPLPMGEQFMNNPLRTLLSPQGLGWLLCFVLALVIVMLIARRLYGI